MGIPGLLKELGRGERIALSKLAVEFLEKNRRPLRIAIDIAIWQFQNQAGQGGHNPALRTFYYRLVKLLALPIHPLFVFDGKDRPLTKRNKSVTRYPASSLQNRMSQDLLRHFQFPYWTARGEAEAECSLLQKKGIVDAVMSQDVDTMMWGSSMTLRDWSHEGTRGNKSPTHVNVVRASQLKSNSRLDPEGMILIAMLSGGDYSPEGVPGFGPSLACEAARADFGADLLDLVEREDSNGLVEWRDRLNYELETNESGYFKTKHKTVKIPDDFPNRKVLSYYTNPAVSDDSKLQGLVRETESTWDKDIEVQQLREYVGLTFNWQYRGGACKFVRSLAPAIFAHRLRRGQSNVIASSDAVLGRQQHFMSDGLPELRIASIPLEVVGIDLEAEPVEPEEGLDEALDDVEGAEPDVMEAGPSVSKPKTKAPAWNPKNVEKIWIPESIVKIGAPHIFADWQKRQIDVAATKQAIAKSIRRTKIAQANAPPPQTNTLQSYFAVTKGSSATKPNQATKNSLTDPPVAHQSAPKAHQHTRSQSTAATNTRRKSPLVPLPKLAHLNPFTLSQSAQARASSATSQPPQPSQPIPLAPPQTTTRKPRVFKKSKTLPVSLDPASPILITSSPISCLTNPPEPSTSQRSCADPSLPSPGLLFKRTHSSTSTSLLGDGKSGQDWLPRRRDRGEKMLVMSRASLEGTWKEVLRGKEGVMPEEGVDEVSLVDLTDA